MASAFSASVIGIGVVGATANALMFYALVKSKVRIGSTKIMLNQMTLDFVCSLMLVFVYAMKFPTLDYSGVFGSVLCKVMSTEAPLWEFLSCSTANLVVLTIERYVKIVHSVLHRRFVRAWMYNVAISLTWLNFEAIISFVVTMVTSEVSNGTCNVFILWDSQSDHSRFAVWSFVIDFLTPLIAFVYCYSRILCVLVATRKINPVSTNHMVKSAAQEKMFRAQVNVVKTFLIVSICFVLCWAPNRIYFLMFNLDVLSSYNSSTRYITVFIAFLNVCLNPFIYAANLDPVKKYLRQRFCGRCRKRGEENAVNSSDNVTAQQETVAGQ